MDSELETRFETCRAFVAEALKANTAPFEPCIFTFGEHPDASQFVEIPWPLNKEALNVLAAQFALSRVEAYALVLRDRLRMGEETKEVLLVWLCRRSFTWGRAWEIDNGELSTGFRDVVDPAALRVEAFKLLERKPMSRKEAKAVREFFEKNAHSHGAPN